MVQIMKVVVCAGNPEKPLEEWKGEKDGLENKLEYVVLGELTFTIGDLFTNIKETTLNLNQGELLKNLKRTIEKKIHWDKKVKNMIDGLTKVSISCVLPEPKEHIIERICSDDMSHIKIKDVSRYTEVEFQMMSISLRFQITDLKAMGKDLTIDPYFIVFRDGIEFQQKLYQSEVQLNCSGGAIFRIFTFGLAGEKSLEKPFKIEFWTGKKFIGITTTTIKEIREGNVKYILRDPSVPNENRGNLYIRKYEEIVWFTEEITRRINSVPSRLVQNFFYLNPFSSMHYLG
jgi:hypothetical protein